jgi:hypothetical protein
MKLTKHAGQRFGQRGFSRQVMEILLNEGQIQNASRGATSIYLGKRESQRIISELKKVIKICERAKNKCILIVDNQVITVLNRS